MPSDRRTRSIKLWRLFLPLPLSAVFVFAFVRSIQTPPNFPATFYGEVQILDSPPSEGDVLQAYIPSLVSPVTTTTITLMGENLYYSINIPEDDTSTTEIEGGQDGDEIQFVINARQVMTGIFHPESLTFRPIHPPAAALSAEPVLEGSPASLNAGASIDAGGDIARYAFDCDNNQVYEVGPQTAAAANCSFDDNGLYPVNVLVTDSQGGIGTATTTVVVNNSPPSASFSTTNPISEGGNSTLILTNPQDASQADTTAGFHYAFNCQGQADLLPTSYASAGSANNRSCNFPNSGVYPVVARIFDKDDGYQDYSAPITVTNLAPSAVFQASSPIAEGASSTLSLDNPSDPSPADITAGFHYAFACDGQAASLPTTYASTSSNNSTVCTFNKANDYAVLGRILDQDDGYQTYTATVTVTDVLPIADAGGPYAGIAGQPVTLSAAGTSCLDIDGCQYAWDLDNNGSFETQGKIITHTWYTVGSYVTPLQVSDDDSNVSIDNATVNIAGVTHSLTLVRGWNLISFRVIPADSSPDSVLSSIAGSYDLVFVWDGSTQTWLQADNIPATQDSLTSIDYTMGVWIHITANGPVTLSITGSLPSQPVEIPLYSTGAGWNLVGFPSNTARTLPAALADNGVGDNFSKVYAYHANDPSEVWRIFDPTLPAYANSLSTFTSGWGYWIRVTPSETQTTYTWTVTP